MTERRHLPVVGNADEGESSLQRSNSQWIWAGAGLIIALSLPLSMLGLWGSRALSALLLHFDVVRHSAGLMHLATLLPVLASYSLAAYLGGLIVVRWGGLTGVRKLVLMGATAGTVLATLAAAAGSLRPWQLGAVAYVTLIVVGAGSAAGAGLSGRRARNTATFRRVSLPSAAATNDPQGEVTRRHEPNR
ncbi:MAG TPA: hypothetical protein VKP30_07125 [Polyangiaceae bacterium]|nr:hypothetical protein [Polyangiaceae bacterium]